ncbi:MAG: alpha/beta fold hydrolase [Bacteroidota bacterium]
MKRLSLFIILFSLTGSIFAQADKELFTHLTETVNRQFQHHRFDSLEMRFDSSLRKGLSAQSLEQTLIGIESQYGEIEKFKIPVVEQIGSNWMARTPIKFAKNVMVLALAFNPQQQLSGIFITSQTGVYIMPNYAQGLSFLESKMEFGTEGWKLNGTLAYPSDGGKHPLVIIVHGSGPLDREGTVGNSKIYRDLSWGLASKGITVFRYDKRSYVHGSKLYMESFQGKTYTAQNEVVDDVLSAIKLLCANSHVDSNRIFIVGHSQGGMMTPMIAQQSGKLKGMILLAANARPIQDMLIEQMEYLYPDSSVMEANSYHQKKRIQYQAQYAKRKKLDPKTPTDSLPFSVSATYWNFLNQYDQVKTFVKVPVPALVLQGERDYQVTMTDFRFWQKAAQKRSARTDFISYPKLNHLFISGEGRSVPAEYQQQGNMDEAVVTDIQRWIEGLK